MTQPVDAFKTALEFTLKWEAGVGHPNDLAGVVNRGISQRSYDTYRQRKGKPLQSVLKISDAEVETLYYEDYWLASKADLMCLPLAVVHFDTAVNFSVRSSIKFLQEALGGLAVDGKFGSQTAAALHKKNTLETAKRYCQDRRDYRYQRVKENPTQQQFLKGWLRRDDDLIELVRQLGEKTAAQSDAGKKEQPTAAAPQPSPKPSGAPAENQDKIVEKLQQAIALLQEVAVTLQQSQ